MFALIVILSILVWAKATSVVFRFGYARRLWKRQKRCCHYGRYRRTPCPTCHANARAWQLLKSHLNWWQRCTLQWMGTFTVWSGFLRLRISAYKESGNVIMFLGPLPLSNFCIVGSGYYDVPKADKLLARKLLWQADRKKFFHTAISQPPLPGLCVIGDDY